MLGTSLLFSTLKKFTKISKFHFALISKLLWVWCSTWKPEQDCSWNVRFLGFLFFVDHLPHHPTFSWVSRLTKSVHLSPFQWPRYLWWWADFANLLTHEHVGWWGRWSRQKKKTYKTNVSGAVLFGFQGDHQTQGSFENRAKLNFEILVNKNKVKVYLGNRYVEVLKK